MRARRRVAAWGRSRAPRKPRPSVARRRRAPRPDGGVVSDAVSCRVRQGRAGQLELAARLERNGLGRLGPRRAAQRDDVVAFGDRLPAEAGDHLLHQRADAVRAVVGDGAVVGRCGTRISRARCRSASALSAFRRPRSRRQARRASGWSGSALHPAGSTSTVPFGIGSWQSAMAAIAVPAERRRSQPHAVAVRWPAPCKAVARECSRHKAAHRLDRSSLAEAEPAARTIGWWPGRRQGIKCTRAS